ncbi:hydrolase TatD [Arthrobacter sp. MYb23]|uniref:Qat anti-phage system TatD family nuclease QatD n=1 Tax=unclassified Arthrobacter TaxID=235627 RepID=UPI000CFC5138|nr:hydrolase TatD [Arthrobacter sp. MYb51]PRB96075.1 hydrolase TatD [Arthrobacter sp. MYb23]
MIDFHCHLDLYPNPVDIAEEARRRNIGVLSVTTTPSAWRGTSNLALGNPAIRTALGLHPQLASERIHEMPLFKDLLPETDFVGEVGLDGSPENQGTRHDQQIVFRDILRACDQAGGRVISVHSRNAASAVMDQLERHLRTGTAILHWFSGNKTELRRAIARDCWFSVGPSMLVGAKGQSLVSAMPRNRVLLESDGPFTAQKGRSLAPWDAALAIDGISRAWNIPPEEVVSLVQSNERSVLRTI